jgi:hypothetical protein
MKVYDEAAEITSNMWTALLEREKRATVGRTSSHFHVDFAPEWDWRSWVFPLTVNLIRGVS